MLSPEPVAPGVDRLVSVGGEETVEAGDEVRSRAATPREGTPEDGEGEKEEREGQVEEERNGGADGEGGDKGEEAGEGEESGEGNEEGEGTGEDVEMNGESETERAKQKVDVETMKEQGTKDVIMAENETNPSSGPAAPSRRPSPQLERQPSPPSTSRRDSPPKSTLVVENEARRSKQLKRFRHAVCHSASLLSLSFDPLGRYV